MASLSELLRNDYLEQIKLLLLIGDEKLDECFYDEWEKYIHNTNPADIGTIEELCNIANLIIYCGKYYPPESFNQNYEKLKDMLTDCILKK